MNCGVCQLPLVYCSSSRSPGAILALIGSGPKTERSERIDEQPYFLSDSHMQAIVVRQVPRGSDWIPRSPDEMAMVVAVRWKILELSWLRKNSWQATPACFGGYVDAPFRWLVALSACPGAANAPITTSRLA